MRGALQIPRSLRDELGTTDSRSVSRRQRVSLAAHRKQQRKAGRVAKPSRPVHSKRLVTRTVSKGQAPPPRQPVPQSNPRKAITQQSSVSTDEEIPDADESDSEPEPPTHVSKPAKHHLDDEDAEIARLEKKLGRKRKKPEDGLNSLFQDLDGVSDEEDNSIQIPKADKDTENWLRAKRRKLASQTLNSAVEEEEGQPDSESEDDVFSGFGEQSGEDEDDAPDGGLDEPQQQARKRENPYAAPVTADTAKYVPPSRRLPAGTESADQQRLKRQTKGLLNRLSETNFIDIVKQLSQLYSNHARHDVSKTILDLLLELLSDPTALNDTFIILHAGFIAALHKTVGIEFGAAAIQRLVEEYDRYMANSETENAGKRPANLMHTLVQLYNFQVITSALIYDFVKIHIERLSEGDAELLLKIVRNAGFQLRQDDPAALKEISTVLQETVKRLGGEQNLNVRTKFMIETIDNLKNNRSKTSQGVAMLNAEHVVKMKKLLTSIQSTAGLSVRTSEPLRISLTDIRDSDLKGKWWLVGASFRDEAQIQGKPSATKQSVTSVQDVGTDTFLSEDSINWDALARAFGMNTDIRKALFISIMTAATPDHARERIVKMRLTRRQMREVPPVVVRCATAEKSWNPYYADIAKKLCQDREIRKAFWNPLVEMLANLDAEDEEDDEEEQWWQAPQVKFNIAKLYGALIAKGTVSIKALASRHLLHPNEGKRAFLELLFVGMFATLGRGNTSKLDEVLRETAGRDDSATLVPILRKFLKKTVAKTVLLAPNEQKAVQWCCEKSENILSKMEERQR